MDSAATSLRRKLSQRRALSLRERWQHVVAKANGRRLPHTRATKRCRQPPPQETQQRQQQQQQQHQPETQRVVDFCAAQSLDDMAALLDFTKTRPKVVNAIWQINVHLLYAGVFSQASAAAAAKQQRQEQQAPHKASVGASSSPSAAAAASSESFPLLEAVEFTSQGSGTLAVRPRVIASSSLEFVEAVAACVPSFLQPPCPISEKAFDLFFAAETAQCATWGGLQEVLNHPPLRCHLVFAVAHLLRFSRSSSSSVTACWHFGGAHTACSLHTAHGGVCHASRNRIAEAGGCSSSSGGV